VKRDCTPERGTSVNEKTEEERKREEETQRKRKEEVNAFEQARQLEADRRRQGEETARGKTEHAEHKRREEMEDLELNYAQEAEKIAPDEAAWRRQVEQAQERTRQEDELGKSAEDQGWHRREMEERIHLSGLPRQAREVKLALTSAASVQEKARQASEKAAARSALEVMGLHITFCRAADENPCEMTAIILVCMCNWWQAKEKAGPQAADVDRKLFKETLSKLEQEHRCYTSCALHESTALPSLCD